MGELPAEFSYLIRGVCLMQLHELVLSKRIVHRGVYCRRKRGQVACFSKRLSERNPAENNNDRKSKDSSICKGCRLLAFAFCFVERVS